MAYVQPYNESIQEGLVVPLGVWVPQYKRLWATAELSIFLLKFKNIMQKWTTI